MELKEFVNAIEVFVAEDSGNRLEASVALKPSLASMRIFEKPIIAVGDAKDAYFYSLKEKQVLDLAYLLPEEWLPEAKRVVSLFLPFTNTVIEENRNSYSEPSFSWLHGRIEGQAFVEKLLRYVVDYCTGQGALCVAPGLDARFYSLLAPRFTSNWSERHVAFGCGLGTFGLSKGIITEKGMAGRLGSVIINEAFPVTEKNYTGLYEYCIFCGKCIRQCPVNAISKEKGKEHSPCSAHLDAMMEKFFPRYGCGKCQVNVPCERNIPVLDQSNH